MKNMLKKWAEGFKKDERGMTLVELLAVVVILGIVGLIAFVSIGNVIENAKKDAHVSNAMQIISAAELYVASGGDADTITDDISDLDTMDVETMIDPWEQEADKDYIATFELDYDDTARVFSIASDHENCTFEDGTGEEAVTKSKLASEGRGLCSND